MAGYAWWMWWWVAWKLVSVLEGKKRFDVVEANLLTIVIRSYMSLVRPDWVTLRKMTRIKRLFRRPVRLKIIKVIGCLSLAGPPALRCK
jgi:hypothetical protein